MAESFDDANYELGAEHSDGETVSQYIHPACHPESSTRSRFEGVRGELPIKVRLECVQCGAHVLTLPLAQDGREALVLSHTGREE